MTDSKPLLWHIAVSHYSEKARWALAYKGVEHDRRAPVPGAHMPIAMWLTRGGYHTLPVLRLDGRAIGDSTAIIAALEERYPDPPLYPDDPAGFRRALELEEYFDEELGPPVRLLAWHYLRQDPARMERVSRSALPGPLRDFEPAGAFARWFGTTFTQARYRVAADEAAAEAREKVIAALDRLDAELDASGGDYLVGDSFSVADLTAASLFYPLIAPPEGPEAFRDPPPALEQFRAPLIERPGYVWAGEMFARHRNRSAS